MSLTRLVKSEVVDTFGVGQFDGSLRELADFISRLIERHGENALLAYGQHDSYDTYYSYAVLVSRPETDKEYENRLTIQKSMAAAEEAREREQLAALMQKYGNPK